MKYQTILSAFVLITVASCTLPSIPHDSETSAISAGTSSDESNTDSATSSDELVNIEGYTRVLNWPESVIAAYFLTFDITTAVPTHLFNGSYWHASDEDEFGPYLEVFNLETNEGCQDYADRLIDAEWIVEDYSEAGAAYFTAYDPLETIYMEFFYYEGDSVYPAGITWYLSPLLAEVGN
jgi:hypothetical protein